MPGYVIGQIQEITDSDGFEAYQDSAGPTLAKYGRKPLFFSTNVEAADGDWAPMGVIVIELESGEASRK